MGRRTQQPRTEPSRSVSKVPGPERAADVGALVRASRQLAVPRRLVGRLVDPRTTLAGRFAVVDTVASIG
jgi:hypothetical protein